MTLDIAWEKEDTDIRSQESWWQITAKFSTNNTTVSVYLGNDSPVLLPALFSVGLVCWGENFLADIKLGLFLCVDAFDLKKSLSWVDLTLVAAERGEYGWNVKPWFLGRHQKRPNQTADGLTFCLDIAVHGQFGGQMSNG